MRSRTEAVEVVRYGCYGKDTTGKQIAYGDGQAVEFVDVIVPGEGQHRSFTLHRDVNGNRPAEGSMASLELEYTPKAEAYLDRSGSPRVRVKDRIKVRAFADVKTSSAVKS